MSKKNKVDATILIGVILLIGLLSTIKEDTWIGITIIAGIIILILICIYKVKRNNDYEEERTYIDVQRDFYKNGKEIDNKYEEKKLLTPCEKVFSEKLEKALSKIDIYNKYIIIPQVNLASIINKNNNEKYRGELFRNIDFGIFEKENYIVKLLIELNDSSHNNPDRYRRDIKVKEICNNAKIPLITFYTKYGNEIQYIEKRIKEYL